MRKWLALECAFDAGRGGVRSSANCFLVRRAGGLERLVGRRALTGWRLIPRSVLAHPAQISLPKV